jgi:hypothetical protein|tara:strand:- start:524 stop:1369 length:846 start_codon:yes stop_codon:yes gene_type:complete
MLVKMKSRLIVMLIAGGFLVTPVITWADKKQPLHDALGQAPVVLAIYPDTSAIPVNVLRFYIRFSKPMQEMGILTHIRLRDQDGTDMTGVFFENQHELWNKDRTEVTLIVDPGRVKTGLAAHQAIGRAFEEGKRYELTVDKGLLDFHDRELAQNYTKQFVAVAEDVTAPQLLRWQVTTPSVQSRMALKIDFHDNIDHLSAASYIKVLRDKREISGDVRLSKHGQVWSFTPKASWQKGGYQIVVNPQLEDIAANSLDQVFDHDVADYKNKKQVAAHINFKVQ